MNKKIVVPLIVVIILLLGGVAYLFVNLTKQQQENREMQELAALDKKEMENEYEKFAQQYSEMRTQRLHPRAADPGTTQDSTTARRTEAREID